MSSASLNNRPIKEDLYATPIPFHARVTLTGDTVLYSIDYILRWLSNL